MTEKTKQTVSLIVGGDYHDIDFVRHNLLGLILERPNLRTRIFESYDDIEVICAADYIVSYTCNVVPKAGHIARLETFVKGGGRWLALHGTNSSLALNENKRWHTPAGAEPFFKLLGSQFAAHPKIEPYKIHVTNTFHAVTNGLEDFVVEGGDELYYMHVYGDINVLMEAQTQGPARGFEEREWDADARHPVLYEKMIGKGGILYFTLGHRRGHWDMQPLMDYYETEEHGAWELPVFTEILRRSITWMCDGESSS